VLLLMLHMLPLLAVAVLQQRLPLVLLLLALGLQQVQQGLWHPVMVHHKQLPLLHKDT
jgi:hypothetical protein